MVDVDAERPALWTIRRTLGISLALFAFYIVAPLLWSDVPPLSMHDVLAILGVVFLGVLLGIVISHFWPLPTERGLPRAIRTAIFSVPALGFGLAIHVWVGGAEAARAYWIMFAIAALLGSTYVTEDDPETEETHGDTSADV